MKNYFLGCFLFIVTISINAQDKINWLSFEEAIAANIKNPKPILIDVYTDWCGWCKKLDEVTYSNTVIIAYINANFYAVKLDGEGKKDITYKKNIFKFVDSGRRGYHELSAALMNGKLSYPTTVFMDKNQQVIQAVPGYLDEKMMEKVLAFFTNDIYKKNDWATFEKSFKSSL